MEAPKTIRHEIRGAQNGALRFGLHGVKNDLVGSYPLQSAYEMWTQLRRLFCLRFCLTYLNESWLVVLPHGIGALLCKQMKKFARLLHFSTIRRSRRDHSLERENRSSHTKSPKHASSRSPSPRTKRLRRPQAEKEVEKVEREYERNHSRGSEKSTHKDRASGKERISERETGGDRKDRRSGRDDTDSKSSRGRHERSVSPSDRHNRSRHRSRSPASNSRSRDEVNNSRGAEHRDVEDDSVAKMKAAEDALEAKQKQKPTFELSGKLAAETNRVRGVTLLFNEPPDARKPDIRWRLYVFKAGEVLNEPLYIHRQSCYLFGRERRVADVPTDHPSCSKQHAVIQFRQVEKEQPDGTLTKQVRPYIMDLGSTNKTFINDNPIEPQRYYELFEKDTIKFGNSSREYVLLHENSSQ